MEAGPRQSPELGRLLAMATQWVSDVPIPAGGSLRWQLVAYRVTLCPMIRTWGHKGLKELFKAGTSAKVRPDQHRRCLRILDALNEAHKPEDMNVPGWHFHVLQGKPKRWAVAVNGPWRITFEFELGGALKVCLEQYH